MQSIAKISIAQGSQSHYYRYAYRNRSNSCSNIRWPNLTLNHQLLSHTPSVTLWKRPSSMLFLLTWKNARSTFSNVLSWRRKVFLQVVPSVFIAIPGLYCTNSCKLQLAHCEELSQLQPQQDRVVTETGLVLPPVHHGAAWKDSTVAQKIRRVWRLVKRFVKLTFTLAPVATFYPLYVLLSNKPTIKNNNNTKQDAHAIVLQQFEDEEDDDAKGFLGWYLRLCLKCVEHSGAAVIKLMQWSSSRPDLFGHAFCHVFAKLQDDTTPHHWRHTCRHMEEAYGKDWRDRIEIDAHNIIGSGCIGQVYKGKLRDQPVAIKVLHPAVQDDIDADLDILRVAVRIAPYLPGTTNLKWLNLEGVVEEFAHLLKLQIDLRREADNLRRFNHNFRHNEVVKFPQLVEGFEPTENILVETFCEGLPVVEFCRQHRDEPELLRTMCNQAIKAVCQMIFLDNYVHGDLHPGNVFISPDGKSFILLDVGIVNEYTDRDHQTIVDILAAFIRKQGRKAGRLMIDDSNSLLRGRDNGDDKAIDEEQYIDKIEALTIAARTQGYFMEHLGTYISYICESAAQHHVMLNPSFITAALAVKLEEGIALAMDPSCNIPKVAIPIIVESERRRLAQSAKDSLGWAQLKERFQWR